MFMSLSGAIDQSNSHLARGHDLDFLNFLHRGMAGKGVRQASRQALIQEMKMIGEAAEILNLSEEIREALVWRWRAIDIGESNRVSIQI